MSKYDPLWQYIAGEAGDGCTLSFEQIGQIAGVPIDHSFLSFKKELLTYGYQVGKISMKGQTVEFIKVKEK